MTGNIDIDDTTRQLFAASGFSEEQVEAVLQLTGQLEISKQQKEQLLWQQGN